MTVEDLRPWLQYQFSRSGGPGGQNVNKLSTRVTLLFDFESCPLLPDEVKARLRRRMASRLAADGRLRVVAQSERTQGGNREIAALRLLEWLEKAAVAPRPRRATRPTAASRRRRIQTKKQRSENIQRRRLPGGDS
ncbi:MAG: aminoacyl-tRNA hydrolase [Phycisphaerales bacterium]|nr:aminoacyl-tRNA hydrolase [Phycisphaerales bacterium]